MKPSPEQKLKMKKMFSKNMSIFAIAKKLGITYNTARYHLDPVFRKRKLDSFKAYETNG